MSYCPVCAQCGREMVCIKNGFLVYHPYEHSNPNEPARIETKEVVIINVDKLIEGSWKDGDIDFVLNGDLWECSRCKARVVEGFGKRMIDYEVPQDELQLMVKEALKHNAAVKITRK